MENYLMIKEMKFPSLLRIDNKGRRRIILLFVSCMTIGVFMLGLPTMQKLLLFCSVAGTIGFTVAILVGDLSNWEASNGNLWFQWYMIVIFGAVAYGGSFISVPLTFFVADHSGKNPWLWTLATIVNVGLVLAPILSIVLALLVYSSLKKSAADS